MDLSKILVISGKPDLNELVSQTRGGAIVKNIVTGQKFPVFRNDRISSLGEIRIYTVSDEVPLEEVLQHIYDKQQAQPLNFDPRKADGAELFDYFKQVLPDYDTDRVHTSDVKKILYWYNILLANGNMNPVADVNTEEADADASQPTDQQ